MADAAGVTPPLMSLSRRRFMATLAGGLLAARTAEAQTTTRKIGTLGLPPPDPLKQWLLERGFPESQIVFVHQHADGEPPRLPAAVAELLRSKPEVILARGPGALAVAVRSTTTIPIVAVDLETPPRSRRASGRRRGGGVSGARPSGAGRP